jgi:hypothetical protein
MSKIEPCPYCGEACKTENMRGGYDPGMPGWDYVHTRVVCTVCTYHGRILCEAKDAISAHNAVARAVEDHAKAIEQSEIVQHDWLSPAETAGLRAEVARLTRERDDAIASRDTAQAAADAAWSPMAQLAAAREALDGAMKSLRVLSHSGAREGSEYLQDMIDVRGYAANRAAVAQAALDSARKSTP